MHKRKLIEVALPLEAINRESAREKSIRHGHPSTLHLWWARRPLAAARAVLFAQMVDDPSSRPEEFPTEELQRKERDRLHGLIERLVVWENIRDQALLNEAQEEILKSTGGKVPPVVDPFAGGGAIPLEAQRLGFEVRASDLNPVAVLINKAMVELPAKFRGQAPVFPGLADSQIRNWMAAEGLAADVRAYGSWLRDQARQRIGGNYPPAVLPDGSEATVIAWIWARTVRCPNPACAIELPLAKTWWLSKKRGKEAYVVPEVVDDASAPGGRRVRFGVGNDPSRGPKPDDDGTVARTAATCIACESAVPLQYVRSEGRAGRLGAELMSVIAEGKRQRIYLPPSDEHVKAADVARPDSAPIGSLPPHGLSPANPQTVRIYGFDDWADLFTPRQLVALCAFSELVDDVKQRVREDGGSKEYAAAIATYIALSVSRCADYWSSMCSWHNTGEKLRNVFGRQAIPMSWDFAEAMPFSESSGGYSGQLNWVAKVLEWLPATQPASVQQADAATGVAVGAISTDPP